MLSARGCSQCLSPALFGMSFQALLLNDDIRHAINITQAPYLGLTSRTPIAWPQLEVSIFLRLL